MMTLVGAVFAASLLGSTHCAGMCGAFLAFAVAGPGERRAPRITVHAAYHLGRLLTYLTLGTIAGVIGSAADAGGSALGVQRAAAMLAGATMIGFGVASILRARGVRVPKPPIPRMMLDAARAGHRWAGGLPSLARAGVTGLLTTLLPCGWLYAFVVTAAGTGDWLGGAATMAAFWAGTLPVMVALGAGISGLAGRFRHAVPTLTSVVLVAAGILTVVSRFGAPVSAASSDADASIERVRDLPSQTPACCQEPGR